LHLNSSLRIILGMVKKRQEPGRKEGVFRRSARVLKGRVLPEGGTMLVAETKKSQESKAREKIKRGGGDFPSGGRISDRKASLKKRHRELGGKRLGFVFPKTWRDT